MAATRKYMNLKTWSFAITGGSTITLTGKTKFGLDYKGDLVEFYGDGDKYPSTVVLGTTNPQMTIDVADVGTAQGLPPGTRGTATAVLLDAKNVAGGAGSGELSAVLSNAIVANNTLSGQHKQFASGTITVQAESTDGVTSPLAITIA